MRTRTISDGRVSLRVSELCLGTMYFGYRTPEAVAFEILDRFLDAGGNFLDTANNYGQWHGDAGESERVIGRWMKSRGVTGEMVVATKVGARTTVPGDPDMRHWQGLGAAAILADAETSLRNLGTGRLTSTTRTSTTGSLRSRRQWTRSPPSPNRARPARRQQHRNLADRAGQGARARPAAYSCVQQQYTPLPAQPDPGQLNLITEELKDYAAAEDLTLLGYSPLLAGRLRQSGQAAARRLRSPVRGGQADRPAQGRRGTGATVNQVVLAALMRSDPPVIPIPGASSVAQLDEILGATELSLDDAQLARLSGAGELAGRSVW